LFLAFALQTPLFLFFPSVTGLSISLLFVPMLCAGTDDTFLEPKQERCHQTKYSPLAIFFIVFGVCAANAAVF